MSSIVNIEYLEDRDEVQVTWPGGTIHRYSLNVGTHQLSNNIADGLNVFFAAGKMDTVNHWVNAPLDLAREKHIDWSIKATPIKPVIDSSMSVERLGKLCEKYQVSVTCKPKSSDTFHRWYLTSKDVALAGDDLVELFAEVKAKEPLFDGPEVYSTETVQLLCKDHGLHITCCGNVWQIRKDGVLLQADYNLQRAIERVTREQVS